MKRSFFFCCFFLTHACCFSCLQLLLLIGAKLEHIINKLAYEVASKHAAGQGEGGIVVRPSDELFWFHSPRLVLVLIHFILFQNAFEFAYFFWTLVSLPKTPYRSPFSTQSSQSLYYRWGCFRINLDIVLLDRVLLQRRRRSASTPASWTDRGTACRGSSSGTVARSCMRSVSSSGQCNAHRPEAYLFCSPASSSRCSAATARSPSTPSSLMSVGRHRRMKNHASHA
jgi:hypothetical protein